MRWIVSVSRTQGRPTLHEERTANRHQLLSDARSEPTVAALLSVFPGAKVRMCKEETGDRSYLRKIRPWYGHHYHFHVRLSCPRGAKNCENQVAPPAGDGCDDAQEWVNNIINPPPPDPNAPRPNPRRELTMADLPGQCVSVLTSE